MYQNIYNEISCHKTVDIIHCHSSSINRLIQNNITTTSLKYLFLPFVNNFHIFPFNKTTHFGFSGKNCGNNLLCNFLLIFIRESCIPLLQPKLALTTEQQHKLHLKEDSHVKLGQCHTMPSVISINI